MVTSLMKILSILCLLGATVATRADVVILNATSTNRVIGLGMTQTVIGSGRVVLDVETGTRVSISWFVLSNQKYFGITRSQPYMNIVVGAGGVRHTVVAYGGMGFDADGRYHVSEGYARGKNVALPIRPTRSVSFPMTFALTARNIQEGPNGTIATEETGVVRFNLLGTQNANAANESVETVIAKVANSLRVQGYAELSTPE